MKRLLPIVCAILGNIWLAYAQQEGDKPLMQPKVYNFNSFVPEVRMDISKDSALFPDSMRNHPEFGILPYNTQCQNCYEEIGKRTQYTRHFVEPGTNGSHLFVQQSFFPLHYKNQEGLWITIDHRMKPLQGQQYGSIRPVKYIYNTGTNNNSIITNQGTFNFNTALQAYFVMPNGQQINSLGTLNESGKTMGSDGVLIANAWPNVDVQHIFKHEGLKTNFVLTQKPNIPQGAEYLVFEELLSIDMNTQYIACATDGYYNADSLFVGDINVKGRNGGLQFKIHEAKYYDGYGHGMPGYYKLAPKRFPVFTSGDKTTYSLQLYVPVSFLNDPNVTYPLYIDPLVEGFDSTGVWSFDDQTNLSSPSLQFSRQPLTCNYTMAVTVPGKSDIQSTFVDLEYETMENPACSCLFNNVFMEIVSLDCGTATGQLSCNPALAPFVGTCTTDPRLVPAASAIEFPGFLNCIAPQCPDYLLDFELRNSQDFCAEQCGLACARAHYWAITIEARLIEDTIRLSRNSICPGDTVTLTTYPRWGVPPYRYEWQPGGQTDSIIIVTPETATTFRCTAYDACDTFAVSEVEQLTILPSPTADAGDTTKICEGGGSATLGGSPTTNSLNASFQWSAEPPSGLSFLSNTTSSNPSISWPAGTTDTFRYIILVSDPSCFRRDTVLVFPVSNPTPVIAPDTAFICPGEGATFATTQPYAAYNWSNGTSNTELTVTELGNFDVTVTDENGCTGTSNSVTTLQPELPTFDVFATPDSTFNVGESAMLGATLTLTTPPVDSFSWGPAINISCLDCPDPVVNPEANQVYVLEVYSQGCRLLDSIFINIKFPNAYWIPRAFTPNQDGLNDRFFIIKESGVTVKDFKIFNRWGQLIYNNAFPWDGLANGEPVDMGVYNFIFTLMLSDGKEVVESGQVTVIR